MPNHITTQVEIRGTKRKIAKLIKDSGIQLDRTAIENKFDFNAVLPMPPSLNILSGSVTDLGLAVYDQDKFNSFIKYPWFSERYPGVETREQLKQFLKKSEEKSDQEALTIGKIAFNNIKKYGHPTWYEWCNEKWGTKWNAYDVQYLYHDDNVLVLELNTAWDTPQGIWDELRRQDFEVRGVMYGEMDGYEYIGDGFDVFNTSLEVEYVGNIG